MSEAKIAFLTNEWAYDPKTREKIPAGSAYYRARLPQKFLPGSVMGMPKFSMRDGFGVDSMGGMFGYDIVVLKLLMEKQVARQIKHARKLGQRIIVDVDDYYPGLTPGHVLYDHMVTTEDEARNVETYEQVILAADTITVTTPFLRDYYGELHPDVRVIPNVVEPDLFRTRPIRQTDRPMLGWFGLTGYRNGDLETLTAWLPDFLEQHQLIFHHSGHHEGLPSIDKVIGLPRSRVHVHPPVPMSRIWKLFDFDIGLVPLSDIPFNHAKSNLKGLEYTAAGLPFIAQALPEYLRLANEGCGRVALTPEDWWTHATELLDHTTRLRDMERNFPVMTREHTPLTVMDLWREAILGG